MARRSQYRDLYKGEEYSEKFVEAKDVDNTHLEVVLSRLDELAEKQKRKIQDNVPWRERVNTQELFNTVVDKINKPSPEGLDFYADSSKDPLLDQLEVVKEQLDFENNVLTPYLKSGELFKAISEKMKEWKTGSFISGYAPINDEVGVYFSVRANGVIETRCPTSFAFTEIAMDYSKNKKS